MPAPEGIQFSASCDCGFAPARKISFESIRRMRNTAVRNPAAIICMKKRPEPGSVYTCFSLIGVAWIFKRQPVAKVTSEVSLAGSSLFFGEPEYGSQISFGQEPPVSPGEALISGQHSKHAPRNTPLK